MATTHMASEVRGRNLETLCGAKLDDNVAWDKASVTCWRCVHLLLSRPIPAEPALIEHDRLKAAKSEGRDATQLIGEFIEWLGEEKRIVLARYLRRDSDMLGPVGTRRDALIAEFFGVNEEALEAEKRALLDYQRALNAAHDWAEKEGRPFLARGE